MLFRTFLFYVSEGVVAGQQKTFFRTVKLGPLWKEECGLPRWKVTRDQGK
jgi:hypothetical protein